MQVWGICLIGFGLVGIRPVLCWLYPSSGDDDPVLGGLVLAAMIVLVGRWSNPTF